MARPPIHPGEILASELAELDLTAASVARALHVPTNRITQIINGERAITADTALPLGQWLGTGPELWLNLRKQYELRLGTDFAFSLAAVGDNSESQELDGGPGMNCNAAGG